MAWLNDVLEGRQPKDLYAVLGCSPTSTQEQIKTEFKQKVLASHPDRHPNNPAARQYFDELTEAYEVLGNVEERKFYDEWRASGLMVPYAVWRKEQKEMHASVHWRGDRVPPAIHSPEQQKQSNAPPRSNQLQQQANNNKSLVQQFRDYDI